MREVRTAVGVAMMTIAVMLASAVPVTASDTPGSVVGGNERIGGRDYNQWTVAWWKWRLTQHGRHAAPTPSSCISARQNGPVWFLGANLSDKHATTKTCAVPAARYLLIVSPAIDCSTVEKGQFYAKTDHGLTRCAHRDWKRYFHLARITVDGVATHPIGYDVRTAAFAFTMPASDNYLETNGHSHGRAAVEANAVMLTPLTAGAHTIVVHGSYFDGPTYTTTYRLTVAAA